MAVQQQIPGLTRTDLQQHDLSAPGREVIQNRAEIAPEAPVIRHKHPGEEISYCSRERSSIASTASLRRRSASARSSSSRPRPSTP